jgi:hypothetical protein
MQFDTLSKLKNFKKIVSHYRTFRGKAAVLKKIQDRIFFVQRHKMGDDEIELMYKQSVDDFLRGIQVVVKEDRQGYFDFGDVNEGNSGQKELL